MGKLQVILSSWWWLIVVFRALIRGMRIFILFYCCFPPMYQILELDDVALCWLTFVV
ncbi:hypothetical protein MtrunA17_Chr0c10g0493591 [Medicago truncatula]|uniref:Transmembrane protein n=1 Tax=Medicago truncatula TaxID=3880 RepID=A0A396GC00_MEDTR|nr:hypothetical protein MtrunA17_Chr0c10g0493591 [Medicago truncatula]